ncbi:4997_t:CDS:2 [Paraglomus brasilianum]|uniref:4997_t:CDS:1 n=1 Tax=Paraglomus brasilianum TaxID=144538 RepID=A0A9N9GE16_9GLOM|nr:4997_t:CDS:2 [Paraglomus brasilianum]
MFLADGFVDFVVSIPNVVFHEELLPIPVLSFMRALYLTITYHKSLKGAQISWFQGIIGMLVTALGGNTTTALLLGQPPSWLVSNTIIPTYVAVHIAYFHLPQVRGLLHSIPDYIFNPILDLANILYKANSICLSGVEKIRTDERYPLNNSWVAMVICGTLSGCAGGLWVSTFQIATPEWGFKSTPKVLVEPSYIMKASFVVSLLYTWGTSGEGNGIFQFDKKEGRALAMLGMSLFSLIKTDELAQIIRKIGRNDEVAEGKENEEKKDQ